MTIEVYIIGKEIEIACMWSFFHFGNSTVHEKYSFKKWFMPDNFYGISFFGGPF
jgi:hypothetical protein